MKDEEPRMSKNYIPNNKCRQSDNPEISELEKLTIKFGRKFKMISIEDNSVYGYTDNKREYLGNKAEYYKYRKLKTKYSSKNENTPSEEEIARKSFLKSYKP